MHVVVSLVKKASKIEGRRSKKISNRQEFRSHSKRPLADWLLSYTCLDRVIACPAMRILSLCAYHRLVVYYGYHWNRMWAMAELDFAVTLRGNQQSMIQWNKMILVLSYNNSIIEPTKICVLITRPITPHYFVGFDVCRGARCLSLYAPATSVCSLKHLTTRRSDGPGDPIVKKLASLQRSTRNWQRKTQTSTCACMVYCCLLLRNSPICLVGERGEAENAYVTRASCPFSAPGPNTGTRGQR